MPGIAERKRELDRTSTDGSHEGLAVFPVPRESSSVESQWAQECGQVFGLRGIHEDNLLH